MAKICQNCQQKLAKMFTNKPTLSNIIKNWPKIVEYFSRKAPKLAKFSQIFQYCQKNQPKLPKTAKITIYRQNCTKSVKIAQNSAKISQHHPKLLQNQPIYYKNITTIG